MKITCQKQELVEALQNAIKAIPSNPNTPITAGFHIKATASEDALGQGELEIQATNNDLYIISRIAPVAVAEPGEVTVTAKYLYDYVRNFPNADITMSDEVKGIFRLAAERGSGKPVSTELLLIAGEFPPLVQNPAKVSFSIPSKLLKKMISESAFAAADEAYKVAQPIFTGILIDIADNAINLVGTNTHRLALTTSPLEADSASGQTVVPAKVLAEIGRQLPDSDEPTTIDISREKTVFSFGQQIISTTVISGAFPDYRRVIPKNLPITATVSRSLLAQTVGRAAIIAAAVGSNTAPIIKCEFAEGHITISSSNQAVGRFEETIDAEVEGELTIAFNPVYINDVLRAVSGETVTFHLAAPLKPGLLIDHSNERFQCVITPIRIKS